MSVFKIIFFFTAWTYLIPELLYQSPYLRREYINVAELNVRSGPSTSDDIIGQLTYGAYIASVDHSVEWSRISYDGKEAYVYSSYVGPNKRQYRQDIGTTGILIQIISLIMILFLARANRFSSLFFQSFNVFAPIYAVSLILDRIRFKRKKRGGYSPA